MPHPLLLAPPEKILIYRIGSLGDTVVALPSLHLIARVFPGAERAMLTNFPVHAKAPAAAAVLGDSGLVHGYMRYSIGTRNPAELAGLAREIRRFRPDLLVYLMPARPLRNVRRDHAFFRWACGVRHFAGLPGAVERERPFDPGSGLYEAEAVRLARSLVPLGDARPQELASWDLRLSAAETAVAAQALAPLKGRPLIACAPGCKMQANDWGPENWRSLLGRLGAKHPSCGLVLCGAREDATACAFASQDWPGPQLNLAGKLSPRESAAIFGRARVFLGPDSGPKHLAAAMGTPCVCVFSARGLPGVWFPPGDGHTILYHQPECRGCGLETCIARDKQCIRAVQVEEMEAAVERVLGRETDSAQLPSTI